MKRLWHDDVRPPPDDTWRWARTNAEAKALLAFYDFDECSLDHDMGLHDVEVPDPAEDPDGFMDAVYMKGAASETGLDLVSWMCETGRVPKKVTVHSWNPDGANAMAARLNRFGHDCYVTPYRAPGT